MRQFVARYGVLQSQKSLIWLGRYSTRYLYRDCRRVYFGPYSGGVVSSAPSGMIIDNSLTDGGGLPADERAILRAPLFSSTEAPEALPNP